MRTDQIFVIDPERDPRWDIFVERHSSGWLYHLTGWKRVLEESFPHMKGFVLVKTDGPEASIVAGLPLFIVSSALTGSRLVSIPFGTLATPLIDEDGDWPLFFDAVLALKRKFRCSRVIINSMRALPPAFPGPFMQTNPYRHHAIQLTKDPAALLKTFDRTCVRQRISRGQASGLSVRIGETEADFLSFYRLLKQTRKRVNRPAQPVRFLRSVWREFGPAGRCRLLLARKDEMDLAGLLLLRYKDRVSAEWAGSDETFRNYSPNQFVFWEAIKSAVAEGYRIFDFGRTARTNRGLMDFKDRWGTAVSDIFEVSFPVPAEGMSPEKKESTLKRVIARACGKTPDFLLEPLGNLLYRHLG